MTWLINLLPLLQNFVKVQDIILNVYVNVMITLPPYFKQLLARGL